MTEHYNEMGEECECNEQECAYSFNDDGEQVPACPQCGETSENTLDLVCGDHGY